MIPPLPDIEMSVIPFNVPVDIFVNENRPPPEPVPSPVKLSTGPIDPPDIDPKLVKMTPTLPDVEKLDVPLMTPVDVFVKEKRPPPLPVPSPRKLSTGPVMPPDIDPELVKIRPLLPDVETVVVPEIVPVEVFVNEKMPPPLPVPS